MAGIPEAGEVVWMQRAPRAGHVPVPVPSPARHDGAGWILCGLLTTKVKGCPFEAATAGEPPCVALADQLKGTDWRAHGNQRKGQAVDDELADMRARTSASASDR